MNRIHTECQPCDAFRAPAGQYESAAKACIGCDKLAVFWCDACGGNHHEGGWQACGYVPAAGCEHPACIGRRDTEPPA